ncbi:uncharacterized protein [Apostichopus japonicus]|uniref:uncharacterized protein isoform X2 n=1 Tax=Stichopus japonicus TaxID=307972 RepID=UPI003AB69680
MDVDQRSSLLLGFFLIIGVLVWILLPVDGQLCYAMKKVSKKSIVLKKVNCNQSGNTDHDVKFSAEVDFSMTTLLAKAEELQRVYSMNATLSTNATDSGSCTTKQHMRTSFGPSSTTLTTTQNPSTVDGSTIMIEDPLTNASCPMWTPYNGSLYCYIEDSTTYDDATEKCRGYSEHAYIVSIETSDENTFVTNFCSSQATEEDTNAATWIGILHRPASFDILVTGENATYHNWHDAAKRWDPCVILRFPIGGPWFDELCYFKFYYVCEYRK